MAKGKKEPIATGSKAVQEYPETPKGFVDKGWSLVGHGELDGALAAFEKAVSMDNQSIDAQYGLAQAASRKGDTARARQAFLTVVELSKSHGDSAKAAMLSSLAQWALRRL